MKNKEKEGFRRGRDTVARQDPGSIRKWGGGGKMGALKTGGGGRRGGCVMERRCRIIVRNDRRGSQLGDLSKQRKVTSPEVLREGPVTRMARGLYCMQRVTTPLQGRQRPSCSTT